MRKNIKNHSIIKSKSKPRISLVNEFDNFGKKIDWNSLVTNRHQFGSPFVYPMFYRNANKKVKYVKLKRCLSPKAKSLMINPHDQ